MIEEAPMAVLFTNDLRATAQFYERLLGFDAQPYGDGLMMLREDMLFLYKPLRSNAANRGLNVLLRSDNVRQLHKQFHRRGVPIMSELRVVRRAPLSFEVQDLNKATLLFVGHERKFTLHQGGLARHAKK
ncbi:MAG: VOC family protein [Pseudomonadota bacterium]